MAKQERKTEKKMDLVDWCNKDIDTLSDWRWTGRNGL